MKHVKEYEVKGDRFDPPHARTIKHLATPWPSGTRNIWMGVTKVDPGNSSNLHSHEDMEEIFYVVSGHGRIRVGEEGEAVEPGNCIYLPIGSPHELINTGDETLKVVAAASPPFSLDSFGAVHKGQEWLPLREYQGVGDLPTSSMDPIRG